MIESKAKGCYVYFQPNEKDISDRYGDCTIRSLCKVLNLTWLETFDLLLPFMRESQCMIFGATLDLYKKWFSQLGFEYHGISNKKGSKRINIKEFSKTHPQGSYIARVANHFVAVVDGKYYDTFDSGFMSMYGFYEFKSN